MEEPSIQLEGERIVLENLVKDDAEELLYLVTTSKESLGRWLAWVETFSTLEMAEAFIDTFRVQQNITRGGALGIRRKQDGALIGVIISEWIELHNRKAAFEYFLGKEFEGNGYATEAMRLVLDKLRKEGIHRVEISAAEGNKRSNALAQRLGFTFEGISRDAELVNGEWHNLCRYAKIFDGNDSE